MVNLLTRGWTFIPCRVNREVVSNILEESMPVCQEADCAIKLVYVTVILVPHHAHAVEDVLLQRAVTTRQRLIIDLSLLDLNVALGIVIMAGPFSH